MQKPNINSGNGTSASWKFHPATTSRKAFISLKPEAIANADLIDEHFARFVAFGEDAVRLNEMFESGIDKIVLLEGNSRPNEYINDSECIIRKFDTVTATKPKKSRPKKQATMSDEQAAAAF